MNYRLITAYLLLRVNLDKIMHARLDFDASSARTRRVSALDKHQNWSASASFCLNSRAQSKYAVVNLGLGISELFLQIWNKTGCFHGQIWCRTRICQNIWPPMTFDTAKVRKFKMAAKMPYVARKKLIFIQYWLITCLFIGYLGQGTQIWNS